MKDTKRKLDSSLLGKFNIDMPITIKKKKERNAYNKDKDV